MYQSLPVPVIALHYLAVFIFLVFLISLAWNLWLSYIQTLFLDSVKWIILEIRPPQDVFKSPLAMELVLNAMQSGGQSAEFHNKYWNGNVSLWYSLEIVSIEGSVHFFMRCPDKFKKTVTSQIYAQYPQAEVLEVPDYAQKMPEFVRGGQVDVWSTRQILEKDEVIPIKTYIDYGLDRAVGSLEEEERIDPITPMLEFLGSLGKNETAGMQILIKPATKRFTVKNKEGKEEGGKSWQEKARDKIKELNAALKEKDEEGKTVLNRPTKGQSALIESIERNLNKYGFDTAIRMLYIAPKTNFDSNRGGEFDGTLRQYNGTDLNNFKKDEGTGVQYPWQDVLGTKVSKLKEKAYKSYKARSFFYGTFKFDKLSSYFTYPQKSGGKPFVMSTEEIATLFHLPGRVAATPTFERIDAKKSEPPINLPI